MNLFATDTMLDTSNKGVALRAATIPETQDDTTRVAMIRFCRFCIVVLSTVMRDYNPSKLDDAEFLQELVGAMSRSYATSSDEEFERLMSGFESCAQATGPRQFEHYLTIFKWPDWKDWFIEPHRQLKAREAIKETERKRTAEREAQRAADEARQADEQRKRRLEQQVAIRSNGDILNVSLYNWPQLSSSDDVARLFKGMKAAFAEARMLQCGGMKYEGEDFGAIRSISSMSAKQLACVKMRFWQSRAGLFQSNDAELLAQLMFGLLDCDGRADIIKTSGINQRLTAMFRMTVDDIYRVDLERQWLQHIDFLEKSIDKESFEGRLARWIVEDRTATTGWATSR